MSRALFDHVMSRKAEHALRSWEDVPLDPELLSLRSDEAAFFKAETGITDNEELRQHIIAVQAEAYKVAPYPCIRRFGFTRLKISRHPAYERVLNIGRTQKDTLLLELACCVGNDARKAVADGWPAERVYASDLRPEFWDIGQKLFRLPSAIRFIPADLFDGESLAPLARAGPFTAVHVAAFFHLFPLEVQRLFSHRILESLVACAPGAIVFGSNIGADVAGASLGRLPYLHNAQSWKEMWMCSLEELGEVGDRWVCEAELRTLDGYLGEGVARRPPRTEGPEMKWLVWSVRRRED